MIFPVVILAGGLAKRLRPLTNTLPKSMVEVAGKPFVFHQIEFLAHQGVREITLCIGHLGEMIEEKLGDGSDFGVNITYSFDGRTQLGTGGAIKKALPSLSEDFFVLYGDSFLPVDLLDVQSWYLSSGKPSLMTIIKNGDQWDKSNVHFENNQIVAYSKTKLYKKMCHIDYGLGLFNKSVFDSYDQRNRFDLAEVYEGLAAQKKLAAFEVFSRFYEIGSHKGLAETEEYLTSGDFNDLRSKAHRRN